jgi:hypothetical protein
VVTDLAGILDTKARFNDVGVMKKMRFPQIDRLHHEEHSKSQNGFDSSEAAEEQVKKENSILPVHVKIRFHHFC